MQPDGTYNKVVISVKALKENSVSFDARTSTSEKQAASSNTFSQFAKIVWDAGSQRP
jgi:hypothetical protein